MNEDATPIPPQWDEVHGLRNTKLKEDALELQGTLQTIKVLQEEVDAIKQRILEVMQASKAEAVMVGELRVRVVKGKKGADKLDTEKLVKLGVTLAQIRAATTPGNVGKPYVQLFAKEAE